MAFMMNVIGTDLVMYKEPKVISSYADIVDRDNVQVLFFEYENQLFEKAPPNSLEWKVWQKRIVIPIEELLTATMKYRPQSVEQKVVAILRDYFIDVSINFQMEQSRLDGFDYIRAYVVRDETGKHFTEHLIYGTKSSPYLKNLMEKASV